MMDCKKALVEADGDVEKASEWLRVKGLASAAKKGERATKEGLIETYVHTGGKLGVIVGVKADPSADAAAELARDIAMHVAASDPTPLAVDRDGIDAAAVEKEKQLLRRQAEQTGKPENVIERIVEGRIGRFFQEFCLVEQPFVKDPDRSVGDLLPEGGSVTGFVRFKVGEGDAE